MDVPTLDEHVPQKFKSMLGTGVAKEFNSSSAIPRHLASNPECGQAYNDNMFSVVGYARSNFHLQVLEALYIKSKDPVLLRCRFSIQNSKQERCIIQSIGEYGFSCMQWLQRLVLGFRLCLNQSILCCHPLLVCSALF